VEPEQRRIAQYCKSRSRHVMRIWLLKSCDSDRFVRDVKKKNLLCIKSFKFLQVPVLYSVKYIYKNLWSCKQRRDKEVAPYQLFAQSRSLCRIKMMWLRNISAMCTSQFFYVFTHQSLWRTVKVTNIVSAVQSFPERYKIAHCKKYYK
jgi:hypothetical protein